MIIEEMIGILRHICGKEEHHLIKLVALGMAKGGLRKQRKTQEVQERCCRKMMPK